MSKEDHEPGQHERALLHGLDLVLSADQLRQVAAAALLCLDERTLSRVIDRLDPDTGHDLRLAMETWQQVIAARQGDTSDDEDAAWRETGREERELTAQWSGLWGEWQAIVEETSDERGGYVHQEHHWEEPYLSAWEITRDLDEVAGRMRPLIPQVVELDLDPDPDFSFVEALVEANDEIGAGLPEWIRGWDEDGAFGPEVTACLLEWQWRLVQVEAAREQVAPSAFDVVDRTLRLLVEHGLPLDRGSVEAFALGLDEAAQRDLHRGIVEHSGEPRWEEALANVHSGLFELHAELLRRFDVTAHLELCRATIDRDWHRAFPVLEDLLARQAFGEAEATARQAARGWFTQRLTRRPGEDEWDPSRDLLVDQTYVVHDIEPRAALLELWAGAARGAGRDELARALELQELLLRSWADWDIVLGALAEAVADGHEALADRLYRGWRDRVVRRSQHGAPPEVSWVTLLADAAREGSEAANFHQELRRWLGEACRTRQTMSAHQEALEALTLALDHGELREASAALDALLKRWGNLDETLSSSLRAWLERLDAGGVLTEVIACWRAGVGHLVPDPDTSRKSNYEEQAAWLRVAFDLDRPTYDRIVALWRQEHGRRRNLWAAIRARGLPLS